MGPPVELLFKVLAPDGREYSVFTDGRIEGFGEDCIVFNYFPALLATATALARRVGK